jgi:hypothetical protein
MKFDLNIQIDESFKLEQLIEEDNDNYLMFRGSNEAGQIDVTVTFVAVTGVDTPAKECNISVDCLSCDFGTTILTVDIPWELGEQLVGKKIDPPATRWLVEES